MIKQTKQKTQSRFSRGYYMAGAAMTVGMMSGFSNSALAGAPPGGGGGAGANDFTAIAQNITGSTSGFPAMISGIAYLLGALLAVLGILKVKDHVENPTNTPLKDGAIRLAAGGGLATLPIILEAMATTIGQDGTGIDVTDQRLDLINTTELFANN